LFNPERLDAVTAEAYATARRIAADPRPPMMTKYALTSPTETAGQPSWLKRPPRFRGE
jgi:hypothetical protein